MLQFLLLVLGLAKRQSRAGGGQEVIVFGTDSTDYRFPTHAGVG